MGTVLGIKKSVYQKVEAKFSSGFSLPPAGANIMWIIDGFKLGSFTDAKTGEDIEYLLFNCQMTDDDGAEHKHGQFFRTEEESDLQELKAFITGIGRTDWNPEDDELDELVGTKFLCDFIHYDSKKRATGEVETKGRLVWKTLVPVNWVDGQSVDAAEAEAPAKPKKPKRPLGKPAQKAPREEEYEEEDTGDDDEGEEEPEEEEEEKGFKSFSPRRTRRRRTAASDKD